MTDLTDLMRRATDDLDVPVTELVDNGVRRGRRLRRRRTAAGTILAVGCTVVAVAAGGALAGSQPWNPPQPPAAAPAANDPQALLDALAAALPAGGAISAESAAQLVAHDLGASLYYEADGIRSEVSAHVVRVPAGAPQCPPPGGFAGTCEARPDGSVLMRYARPAEPGSADRLVAAVVELRRPDGVGVRLQVTNVSATSVGGHAFTLDELTAMLTGSEWPAPSGTGPAYGPRPGQFPVRTRDGRPVLSWDGRTVYATELPPDLAPSTALTPSR